MEEELASSSALPPSGSSAPSQIAEASSAQTKKKSVNFDNVVRVQANHLGTPPQKVTLQQRQEQLPPTPILKRGADAVASSSHFQSSEVVASSAALVQKKRKRGPLDTPQDLLESDDPDPEPPVSSAGSTSKPLKRQKAKKVNDITDDTNTVSEPAPIASTASRTAGRESTAVDTASAALPVRYGPH